MASLVPQQMLEGEGASMGHSQCTVCYVPSSPDPYNLTGTGGVPGQPAEPFSFCHQLTCYSWWGDRKCLLHGSWGTSGSARPLHPGSLAATCQDLKPLQVSREDAKGLQVNVEWRKRWRAWGHTKRSRIGERVSLGCLFQGLKSWLACKIQCRAFCAPGDNKLFHVVGAIVKNSNFITFFHCR